jgi:hypothetical protein
MTYLHFEYKLLNYRKARNISNCSLNRFQWYFALNFATSNKLAMLNGLPYHQTKCYEGQGKKFSNLETNVNINRYNVRLNILYDLLYVLKAIFQSWFFQIGNYDLTLKLFAVLWNSKNEGLSFHQLSNYHLNQNLLCFPISFKFSLMIRVYFGWALWVAFLIKLNSGFATQVLTILLVIVYAYEVK